MPQLFTNNARALLASGVSESGTSLTVEASKADLFPTANTGTGALPSANNWFKATIQDAQGATEIIYVRTRTSGSGVFSNVLRGQEGTVARSFSAGAVVGLRLTALDVQQSINVLSNNNVFSGTNTFAGVVTFNQTTTFNQAATFNLPTTFNQASTFTQAVTFNGGLSGDVAGNVTGNLTGNVTGNLRTGNFLIQDSGGKLSFIAETSFTASIAGSVMTVTAATVGAVNPGSTLSGQGVSSNTKISNQLTSTEPAGTTKTYSSGGDVGELSLVVSSASGIKAGQMISGIGIPAGTFVASSYSGTTRVPLANGAGQPVALTSQAAGSYTFSPASGRGTYTVSISQSTPSTTITSLNTIASINRTGLLIAASNVVSNGTT
jgi:hypothetical protein